MNAIIQFASTNPALSIILGITASSTLFTTRAFLRDFARFCDLLRTKARIKRSINPYHQNQLETKSEAE